MKQGSVTPLVFTTMGGIGKAAKVVYGQTASSFDCDKEGPTLQASHWLDVICTEFQLIEIGNRVPPWGPSSIPQQTGQC